MGKVKKVLNICGRCLLILSVVYLIKKLQQIDVSMLEAKGGEIIVFLLLISLIPFLICNINAYIWKLYLDFLTNKKNRVKPIFICYLKSNIAKYLPGNVAHYIGRNVLGNQIGIAQKYLAMSSIFEVTIGIITSLSFCVIISYKKVIDTFKYLSQHILAHKALYYIFFVLCILGLSVGIGVGVKNGLGKKLYSKYRKRFIPAFSKVILIYFIEHFLYGLLMVITVYFITGTMQHWNELMSAHILSWLAGYVVPGSPGGIGIKESVTLLLLHNLYDENTIVFAAAMTRISCIFGDCWAYLFSIILKKMNIVKREW